MNTTIATNVLNIYKSLFSESMRNVNEIGNAAHKIPKFSEENIRILCTQTIEILESEATLLKLNFEGIVVGDLHGSLQDLLRIFQAAGIPPIQRYIFLGDYIDRGEFSIEVVTLLFALKIIFPSHIYLLRGNHEFADINAIYGFKQQCLAEYSEQLFFDINRVFSYLPLAAITRDRTFLVHGGLSPALKNVEQIELIPRPYESYENTAFYQLVLDLVWSDPSESQTGFKPSARGTGQTYGIDVVTHFLKSNGLKQMIRGHQCVSSGVEQFHSACLYTVFTASNYAPDVANLSGIIKLSHNGIEFIKFPPIRHTRKTDSNFTDFDASTYQYPLCHSAIRSFSKQYRIGGMMRPGAQTLHKKLFSPSTGNLWLKTSPVRTSKANQTQPFKTE